MEGEHDAVKPTLTPFNRHIRIRIRYDRRWV